MRVSDEPFAGAAESDLTQVTRLANRMRSVLEALPVAVALFDSAGELADTNRGFRHAVSVPHDRPLRLDDLVRDEDWPALAAALEDVRAGADDLDLCLASAPGGRLRLALVADEDAAEAPMVLVCLPEAGRLPATVRRATRKLPMASRGHARGHDLQAAALAHDLRTPLRALGSLADLVLESGEELAPAHRIVVRRISRHVERMSGMVESLLALHATAEHPVRFEPIDLGAVARSVINDLYLSRRARRVNVDIAPGLRASGDPTLLRVVMQNLIENAWKFSAQRDEPHIEIGSVRIDDEPCFFVRDNGLGFESDETHRLFGALTRLHDREDFPGVGLGLYQVRRIIERHGGKVWAAGEPGRGAIFCFSLGPGEPARVSAAG